MIDKETLFKELTNELKLKKDFELFSKQLKQIDNNINNSKTYNEFLKKTNPIFDKIKKENTEYRNRLVTYYSKNHCYHLKPEWRKDFEIQKLSLSFDVGKNPNDPEDTYLDYLNDEKLFNLKYKNENFFIESITFSSRPKTKEKEVLIDRLLKFLKDNKDIYEFINYSLQSNTNAWIEKDKVYQNTVKKLRDERVYLFEYISTRKSLIEKSNYGETKILFEHDENLVKQNINMYPIMLNYIDYIKTEILKANYKSYNTTDVFHYISGITNKLINWTAIKKYYYDKYIDLIKK